MQSRESVDVVEWVSTAVPGLTDGEARALEQLGSELKGSSPWWGGVQGEDPDSDAASSSVIRLSRRPKDTDWCVQVTNAVGVVGVGNKQLIVHPKIGERHFNFIASMAIEPPRTRIGDGVFGLDGDRTYLHAVWKSYLDSLATTLTADLHRDYQQHFEDIDYVRGTMDPRRSSLNLARGVFRFPSRFEDLTEDNPVNRVLKAAAIAVGSGLEGSLGPHGGGDGGLSAKRAWAMLYRLGGVGDLVPGDDEVAEPRLAVHQKRALGLARHVLSGFGRSLRVGDVEVSCFLHPTPELMEDGIRELLNAELGSELAVSKRRRMAARLSFNPDLVVEADNQGSGGPIATGDVKYRLRRDDWPRSTLLQAMGFAQVFSSGKAFFVDFSNDEFMDSNPETIADIEYRHVTWRSDDIVDPVIAAARVVDQVREFVTA